MSQNWPRADIIFYLFFFFNVKNNSTSGFLYQPLTDRDSRLYISFKRDRSLFSKKEEEDDSPGYRKPRIDLPRGK